MPFMIIRCSTGLTTNITINLLLSIDYSTFAVVFGPLFNNRLGLLMANKKY